MNKIFVKKRFTSSASYFCLLSLLLLQFNFSSTEKFPSIKISAQDSSLNINYQLINIVHLGQKRMIGALIWIETLLNSDLEHYNNSDLNSWMYHRFNALIELDPKFYEVYRYGAQYLSIVKDDEIGAEDIYRRGLKVFPNNFWLNFHAGFHYYFEMDLPLKALPIFKKIAYTQDGLKFAPFLSSLTAKIMANQGGVQEEDFAFLYTIYRNNFEDQTMRERLEPTLYAMRCQLDLLCLNGKKINCHYNDLDGKPYLFSKSNNTYSGLKNCSLKIKTRSK